jgi:beta-glucanase (GH16 family)
MRFLTIIFALMTSTAHADAFRDDFNRLNERHWTVSQWQAPGGTGNHHGVFDDDHVDIVNGYLRLRVDQTRGADGLFRSFGGEIQSNREFGYGVYEFRMRAASTSPTPHGAGHAITGSVSASFVYAQNAVTEIDIEFESHERSHKTHFLTWIGEHRDNQHTQLALPGPSPYEQFYTYHFVWQPGMVTFYRDGEIVAQHRNVVPSQPGRMIFNHWGSHNQWWGGWSTQDVPRYVYIDYFQFTPLDG